MSLRAMKTLARTPPGCMYCVKQVSGVVNRVSESILPSLCYLGDLKSDLGLDSLVTPVTDRFKPSADCLDLDGCNKSDPVLHQLSPLPVYPSTPLGHMTCSRQGSGKDSHLSMIYSPSRDECMEYGCQVSSCMVGGFMRDGPVVSGSGLPADLSDPVGLPSMFSDVADNGSVPCQVDVLSELKNNTLDMPFIDHNPVRIGSSLLTGNLLSSLRLGTHSDSLVNLQIDFKGANVCYPLETSNLAEPRECSLVSPKAGGMDLGEGLNPDLGHSSKPVFIQGSIRSQASDSYPVFESPSFRKGNPKVIKRQPKPIKKISPVLMTLGEDIHLNDIVLTNALTLVGRFGR